MFGRAFGDIRGLGMHRSIALQVTLGSSMTMIMGASLVYPVLPVIAQSLDVPEGQIGLVLTAFTLPAVFLAPVTGALSDLRGRRLVLVGGLLVYGFAGLSIALVDTLPWLLVLRAVQGVGYAAVMPLVVVLVGDAFPDARQQTTAQGVKVVLDRMTLLVLPAAAGVLGGIAWQWPFVIYGVAVPLALAALRWLPEPAMQPRTHAPSYLKEVAQAAVQLRSLVIFSMSSLRFFIELSFFIYVPLFALNVLGVSIVRGGLLFTVFALGSIATAGAVGPLAARFERVPLVAGAFVVQAAALLGASVAPNEWVLGGAMLVFGLANGIISPVQKSLLTQSVPPELRGGYVSADRLAQSVAKSIAPLAAGGVVALAGIAVMFQVIAGVAGAWALGVVVLDRLGLLRSGVAGVAAPLPGPFAD